MTALLLAGSVKHGFEKLSLSREEVRNSCYCKIKDVSVLLLTAWFAVAIPETQRLSMCLFVVSLVLLTRRFCWFSCVSWKIPRDTWVFFRRDTSAHQMTPKHAHVHSLSMCPKETHRRASLRLAF